MPSLRWLAALVSVVCLSIGSCTGAGNGSDLQPPSAAAPQGWDTSQRLSWYTSSQGSRLIPKAWLTALEQPTATTPFLDRAYVDTFQYLPLPAGNWLSQAGCPIDPRLPLGFTTDCQSDVGFSQTKLRWKTGQSSQEPWVGMNCAACHTNRIDYKGQSLVIDGAPTLADFQTFMERLRDAVANTASDKAKFARFATAVLGPAPAASDRDRLRGAMTLWVAWTDSLARLNDPGDLRYGFGRLDAIGHIFNKVALAAVWPNGGLQTPNPADAPVSYPFLWNVPQLDKVEWNGLAENTSLLGVEPFNYGGLGRNTGEVIGVFADITLKPQAGARGYVSSALVERLDQMEVQLGNLYPPAWPAMLPPIDQALAAEGATLFTSVGCSDCHRVSMRNDLKTKFAVTLNQALPTADLPPAGAGAAVGTDMWMACNAVLDTGVTGVLQGSKSELITGDPFGANAPVVALVQNAVVGTIAGQKGEVLKIAFEHLFGFARGLPPVTQAPSRGGFALNAGPTKQQRRDRCRDPRLTDQSKVVYKGRPLQGVWATAPYLHNGSVPNLYEILLPPSERSTTFPVGTREFDPVNVGFCTKSETCTRPLPANSFPFDTSIEGNANIGHDYGNGRLSDRNRKALVEYMKTL